MMKYISLSILCILVIPLLLGIISLPSVRADDPPGNWGYYWPAAEDPSNLTLADMRIVPDGYEYIGLWEMYPNSGELPHQDIDDFYIVDVHEPWAETGDNYIWMQSGANLRQCTFTFQNIEEYGTGRYEILVSIIVASEPFATWWVSASGKWSANFTTSGGASNYQIKWIEYKNYTMTGTSWTTQNINSLKVSILLDAGVSGVQHPHRITQLSVLIRDVAPPPPGLLILRPDADGPETIPWGSPDFVRYPPETQNNWSLLDETTYGSDTTTTYIEATTEYDLQQCIVSLSNLQNRPTGEAYGITLWVIARSTVPKNWEDDTVQMVYGLRGYPSYAVIAQEMCEPLYGAWVNYTLYLPLNPITGGTWTLQELNNLYGSITVWNASANSNAVQISQIAVLVHLTDYIPGTYLGPAEVQTFGIIWMLILFLPAMAFAQVVPKIGFAAGITIMLVILGATQSGFIPTTIFGLIAVGILMYKGE